MSVLAIQPGAIGDFVLSLPALRWLRQAFGGDGMEIWAERANVPLVEHPAYCDRARPLAETGFDSYPLPARTLEALKAFNIVVSWRGAQLAELVDAVTREHRHARFLRQFPPEESALHLVDFRRSQLQSLFGQGPRLPAWDSQPRICFHEEDEAFATGYLAKLQGAGHGTRQAPLVAIHPGASGPRKRWSAARFAKLAVHFAGQYGARVLVTEGPLDGEAVHEMLAAAPELRARRVAIPQLRHLAAVLARCSLFVGNDSGIAHLAAAVSLPVLSIFTASDPRTWAPRGQWVRALVTPSFEDVIEQAAELLKESGARLPVPR